MNSRYNTRRTIQVIVIDDEPRWLSWVAGKIAYLHGCQVITYSSAESAMTALAKGKVRPDIIFTDLGMSGMDGYAFIAEFFRKVMSAYHCPVVAMTADSNPCSFKMAETIGASACMSKDDIVKLSRPFDSVFVEFECSFSDALKKSA